MRIGVVSDTHNHLRNVGRIVELFNAAGVERVVHTGDITQAKTLEVFARLEMPMVGVYGNNDVERDALEHAANDAGIELVDPGLEEAAAVLGAGPWRRLATVTLPLAAPGLVAGLVLGFARSLGEFGATITLAGNIAGETRTLPLAIHNATQVPDGEGAALRLTLLSIALSLAALAASELFLRRLRRKAQGAT